MGAKTRGGAASIALRLSALLALAVFGSACASPICGLPGRPAHHGTGGFCNEPGAPEPTAGPVRRALDGLRIATARERSALPEGHQLSQVEAVAALRAPAAEDRITWLGHASVLLELGGRRVLIDPVWSTYVTPLPPIGPKRVSPPPVPLEALPPLDVILITHSHYDHLDTATLRAMPGKERVEIVAPLGLAPLLRSLGYADVTELDWWQRHEAAGVGIVALPAAHGSGRRPFASDDTLWASFALTAPGPGASRIYVSGDSGYHTHFRRIGRQYGPFDLAVMFLGGYGPRDVAKARHFTPSQGVEAVEELRARWAVPVHWGTYPLGAEPTFGPGPAFEAAARAAGWPEGRADVMAIGETRAIRPGGGPPVAARR